MKLGNITLYLNSILKFFLPAIGIFLSFLMYKIQKRQLATLKWNQVAKTMDLLAIWNGPHIASVRQKVSKYIEYEKIKPLNIELIIQDENYKEISSVFIQLLNYLDLVCLFYLKKVIDPEICYTYLSNVIVNHYVIFKPFINHLRKNLDISEEPVLRTYGHLEIVAQEWLAEMEKDANYLKRKRIEIRYEEIRKHQMDDGV